MFRLLAFALLISATGLAHAAGNVGEENPNAISIEGLGRGLGYSIDYDHSFAGGDWAVGVGFESLGAHGTSSDGTTTTSLSIIVVPLYFNYYFYNNGSNRFFATGGVDILSVSGHVDSYGLNGTGAAIVGGAGYEYRGESGFLFRGALYLFIGDGIGRLWPGLSLGYAF